MRWTDIGDGFTFLFGSNSSMYFARTLTISVGNIR
jgi:hypothetical protein